MHQPIDPPDPDPAMPEEPAPSGLHDRPSHPKAAVCRCGRERERLSPDSPWLYCPHCDRITPVHPQDPTTTKE